MNFIVLIVFHHFLLPQLKNRSRAYAFLPQILGWIISQTLQSCENLWCMLNWVVDHQDSYWCFKHYLTFEQLNIWENRNSTALFYEYMSYGMLCAGMEMVTSWLDFPVDFSLSRRHIWKKLETYVVVTVIVLCFAVWYSMVLWHS